MAIYNLTVTDNEISVQGRYASVKNNGAETVYASSAPDLELNAPEVVPIQPGESVIVRDCRKKLYVRGSGEIAVVSGNEPVNFFRPAPKGYGGGSGDGVTQQQLNDTLKTYATNSSVDTKLEEYVSKDEIPGNPNLLLNPDFKVNQRGKSEYGYDGSDRYTVDRWKLQANLTLTVHSDYVTVSRHDPTSNSHTGFRQDLNISDDTLVTLQVCVKGNGSFTLFHNGFNGTAEIQVQDTDGWVVVKCTGYGASEVGILLRGTATSLDIKWIKLELGAVSTPFVPPNPIEEALKCGAIEEPAQQILYGNGTWATAPSNPNLLDNPDFKINQRGQSEYTGITYTVDRWRTFDSKSKIQVVNSGIKITTLTAANENENTNPLFQIFDRPVDTYNGKQFTLSLKAINITGPWRVCIRFGKSFPSGDYVTVTYRTISSEINHWTFTVPDQAVSMRIGIVQHGPGGSAIGDTITIEWIKLELGAVATPFIPPNPATELLKCQRYYWKSLPANHDYHSPCLISERWDNNTAMVYRCEIQPPVQMRVTPSLKVNGKSVGETVSLRHTATDRYVTGTLSATDIFSLTKDKLYRIGLTNPDKEVEINHHYEGTIELSADL